MSQNSERPENRLSTSDREGHRLYLYPEVVHGRFRTLRSVSQALLCVVFLVLPWIKIGGQQSILIDLIRGRFSILGITFWAHDIPILFYVLFISAMVLALMTAILGRVWCGWACPQTVFVDGIFRRLETWIEGDSFQRKKLDEASLNFEQVLKKSLKWLAFTVLSAFFSNAFLAYFVGTEHLIKMIGTSPFSNPTPFLVMLAFTAATAFDFGWFREQFCTVVCPYGRLQSVFMDSKSLVISYDQKRGEPRGKKRSEIQAGSLQSPLGDCVDCGKCVQVCPTGIDIRKGVQMECIACTACIDACDSVMTKVHRPTGLIKYDYLESKTQEAPRWIRTIVRPRTVIYFLLLLVSFTALKLTLSSRHQIHFELIRAVGSPFETLGDTVINHFKIDYENQSFLDQAVTLSLTARAQEQGQELVLQPGDYGLPAGAKSRRDIWIKAPRKLFESGQLKSLVLLQAESKAQTEPKAEHQEREVNLVGPY